MPFRDPVRGSVQSWTTKLAAPAIEPAAEPVVGFDGPIADTVRAAASGAGPPLVGWGVSPVEDRRGRPETSPGRGDCDRVQQCARALCPEEMPGVAVPGGRLFYGKTCRRTDVPFDAALRDAALRDATRRAAARLHELVASRGTACVACGFDFGRAYRPPGEGFIHVHHLAPAGGGRGRPRDRPGGGPRAGLPELSTPCCTAAPADRRSRGPWTNCGRCSPGAPAGVAGRGGRP